MVDVVYGGIAVDELDEVLDDLHDILLRKHAGFGVDVHVKFLVQAVAAYGTKVIALFGEEKLVDDVTGGCLIRGFGIAELLVDVVHSLDFRIGRVLLQGVVDDGVFGRNGLVLLEKDGLDVGVGYTGDGVVVEDLSPLYDGDGTLDGDDLAGILVFKVLDPGLEHIGGKFAALVLREDLGGGCNFVGKAETVKDVFVGAVSDGAQKGCYGQLLLTVYVGEHHVVDVRGKLYPGALERNDTGAVELGSVGVHALVEEHARGTVKLRNDNSLGAVDDERTCGGHVGDVPEVYVLHAGVKVLVLRVRAGKAEFCLQRNIVCESSLKTLLN